MNVNDIVAAKVEAARRRIAADKQRRDRQAAARNAGLSKRHAAKLRHLADADSRAPEGCAFRPPTTPTLEGITVPVRVATCPACRRERITKRVAGVTIAGRPHDVLQCPDRSCELTWCVRADRPRVPVAA